MMIKRATFLLCIGAVALGTGMSASAGDLENATKRCYGVYVSGWGVYGPCVTSTGVEDVCLAYKISTGVNWAIQCDTTSSTTSSRGPSDDPLTGIFKAGKQVRDGAGKLVEIDGATGELIQVATSINALQSRGVPIGDDVNAAFEEAGIPVVESVTVEVADDPETGGQKFTLRGASSDEPGVMRFDANGKLIDEQDEPPPEIMEKIEAMKSGGE